MHLNWTVFTILPKNLNKKLNIFYCGLFQFIIGFLRNEINLSLLTKYIEKIHKNCLFDILGSELSYILYAFGSSKTKFIKLN